MASEQDILVLREMVRLAENRRTEELEGIERINKYNLALIAFTGSFLSLLITTKFPTVTVLIAGGFSLLSIGLSLVTIRPRTLRGGGALSVRSDVTLMKNGEQMALRQYLLDTAELTDLAATSIGALSSVKKRLTIYSALSLAAAMVVTYTFYVYA